MYLGYKWLLGMQVIKKMYLGYKWLYVHLRRGWGKMGDQRTRAETIQGLEMIMKDVP